MKNNIKAFTLIELLVVVLIIGILAAIAVPQYQRAVEKARAAEALSLVRAIADANRRYYMANGEYTWSLADLDVEVPGTDATYEGMDRKDTKYFEYGARAADKTDTSGIIALASRLPFNTKYILCIFADKPGVYCRGVSSKGLADCKMLGADLNTSLSGYYYPINF